MKKNQQDPLDFFQDILWEEEICDEEPEPPSAAFHPSPRKAYNRDKNDYKKPLKKFARNGGKTKPHATKRTAVLAILAAWLLVGIGAVWIYWMERFL